MGDFATAQDMSDRSDGEITSESHPFLTKELAAATRAIREVCGWHVATREQLRYRRVFREPDMVFLTAMKIVSIEQVVVDGQEIDLDRVEFDPCTGGTNILGRVVDIRYTAGFETVPEPLLMLTLELAAAGLGAGLGLDREQAGSVVVAYRSSTIGERDLSRLAPYKIGPMP